MNKFALLNFIRSIFIIVFITNLNIIHSQQNVLISQGGSVTVSTGDKFYDAGGPSGNDGNTDYTITLCPSTAGDMVALDFTYFKTHWNWLWGEEDALYIYDGTTATGIDIGKLMGDYTVKYNTGVTPYGMGVEPYGANPLIGTPTIFSATNPSGCLTLKFVNGYSSTWSGWEANIITYTPLTPNCNITLTADNTTICSGETVNLTATGTLVGAAMNNDFNNSTIGTNWQSSIPVTFTSNACSETNSDGSIYVWMQNNACPRTLATNGFDVSNGGTISFDYRQARGNGNASPCESPDQGGGTFEGVYVQYSTDGGSTWTTFKYMFPNATEGSFGSEGGLTGCGDYVKKWTSMTYPIPAAAQTVNTQFRWLQDKCTNSSSDNWGIDNVIIASPKTTTIRIKENSNTGTVIASSNTSPLNYSVSPTSTTTYYATISDGLDSCTQQITVTVTPPTTPTFTQIANLCENGPVATLPTSSEDAPAITGSWNSATATTSSSGTTTYTFTPDPGQCAGTTTMDITVDPSITPTFTAVADICSGDALSALPTTSTNTITGTWTPAIDNTNTTTYTFTPTAGQCATNSTLTITVNPIETPTVSCGTSTSSSVQFNWGALTGASSYAITYTVNGGASQSGGSVATPTFSLSSLSPGDVVAITIVTTGTGCYANGSGSCTAQACTAPTISAQPAAHSACEGQPATFSVTATGASGYQWEVSTDGGTIYNPLTNTGGYTGATTATLSISDNTGLDTYLYRVVVAETNALCPTTSTAALLTATTIETPTVTCGTSTSTSVQFNWVALTGASSYAITYTVNGGTSQSGGSVATPTFSLSSLSPGDVVAITIVTTGTGCYANGSGSCTAQACTAPTISAQPAAHSACEGQPATFSVTATGASGYQWEVSTDGGTIYNPLTNTGGYTGATTATLSISDNTGLDTYLYRVVVAETNALCPTTSTAALLTATTIETPTVTCGTSTSTSVQFNWVALTGASSYAITYTVNGGASQSGGSVASSTFSLSSLSPGDVIAITIVTTGTGCYSNGSGSCTAQNCTAPTITSEPTDQIVCASSPATFSVTATGASGYQWEVSTNGGGSFSPLTNTGVYSGVTTATLTISNCTGLTNTQYRVVVAETNGLCSTTSAIAVLSANIIETPVITCGVSTLSSVEFNWSALTGATSYTIGYSINSGTSQNGGTVTSPTYTLSSLNPGDIVDITINTTGSTSCYAQSSFSCNSQICTSPTIINQPTLSPSCEGQPETLSVTASSEATGYSWEISTDGGNSFTPLFNAALYSGVNTSTLSITDNSLLDTYQYRVVISETNNTCPTTSNPVTFIVNPSPTISGSLVACPTFTSQLSATTTPSLTTPWTSASTNIATIDNTGLITAQSGGTSLITFTDINGCTENITMTVPADDTPTIACGTSTTSSVTFDWNVPSTSSSFDITYSINGQNPINVGNQNIGSYSLNNLTVDDTVSIVINTNGTGCYQQATGICYSESCTPSEALFFPDPKTITSSNPITNFVNNSTNSSTYLWDFGDGNTSSLTNPNHEYTINEETDNYQVTLIAYNIDGCNDTVSQTVLVKEELIYYVPNTFTPNGDEFNNEFKPIFYSGYDPYSYTMVIFNRWGEIVYETSNLDIGWKGTYGESGDIVQDGVYIWKINFNEKGIDKNIEITGHVLIIK